MLCRYCHRVHGFNSSAERLFNAICPFASITKPTGCCIQASVAMMKKPESHEPTNTMKADHQCPLGPSRFSPNRNSPRKVDSRKNENTPSMASVWPITPPAAFENGAQFVPN